MHVRPRCFQRTHSSPLISEIVLFEQAIRGASNKEAFLGSSDLFYDDKAGFWGESGKPSAVGSMFFFFFFFCFFCFLSQWIREMIQVADSTGNVGTRLTGAVLRRA